MGRQAVAWPIEVVGIAFFCGASVFCPLRALHCWTLGDAADWGPDRFSSLGYPSKVCCSFSLALDGPPCGDGQLEQYHNGYILDCYAYLSLSIKVPPSTWIVCLVLWLVGAPPSFPVPSFLWHQQNKNSVVLSLLPMHTQAVPILPPDDYILSLLMSTHTYFSPEVCP